MRLHTAILRISITGVLLCVAVDGQGVQSSIEQVQSVRLHPVKKDGKWGYADANDTMVIAPQFEAVEDFSEGLAAVSVQIPFSNTDTWGYIDNRGEMVIKPQFSMAHPFSEGLALVWAGGVHLLDPVVRSFVNMGYIDKTGKWVIRSKLAYFFYNDFSGGFVAFKKSSSKWGYMDKRGKIIIKPRFGWAGNFSDDLAPVVVNGNCAHVNKAGTVVGQLVPLKAGAEETKGAKQDRRGRFTSNPTPPPCL